MSRAKAAAAKRAMWRDCCLSMEGAKHASQCPNRKDKRTEKAKPEDRKSDD
jgi:hypothetical protein